MSVQEEAFGTVNGLTVSCFSVQNGRGSLRMKCCEYGCTILSIMAPGRDGNIEEVTLCYPTLTDLIGQPGPYYGCIVGRVANRICDGKFELDRVKYELEVNNGTNALHGGFAGFDKQVWKGTPVSTTEQCGVRFEYTSSDGEGKYPGTLHVIVKYLLSLVDDTLTIDYSAVTADKPTIVNLTNHTYWNLSGNLQSTIHDHRLKLSCSQYLPVDKVQIPTGDLATVTSTLFDFCSAGEEWGSDSQAERNVHGVRLRRAVENIDGGAEGVTGIDHTFVIDQNRKSYTGIDTSYDATINTNANTNTKTSIVIADAKGVVSDVQKTLVEAAVLTDDKSGRRLTVSTTQPGIQVYTANFLPPPSTESKITIHCQHNAICLETQDFPDAINQPSFQSQSNVILRPGEVYSHRTTFRFDTI